MSNRKVLIILGLLFQAILFSGAQNLPNALWRISYVSSEEKVNDYPNGSADLLFDNDKETFWHSRWSGTNFHNPQEIQLDLGAKALLTGAALMPRQNNSSGRCSELEMSVSMDGRNWMAVKRTVLFWKDNNDFSEKHIDFGKPVQARYFKYRHLKSVYNGEADTTVASLAELKLRGVYAEAVAVADLSLGKPRQDYLVGEKIRINNTSKAYRSAIYSVKWYCPGAEISVDKDRNAILSYSKSGVYSVALEVVNNKGFRSKKVLRKLLHVLPASPLDRQLWRIHSYSDQDTYFNGFAHYTIDGISVSRWVTSWDQLKSLPHFVVYDLGHEAEISGFGYLPVQSNTQRGLATHWNIYISSKASDWGIPVASGRWDYVNRELKIESFRPVRGRFVKFEVANALPAGRNDASCAEFYLYGKEGYSQISYLLLTAAGLLMISILFLLIRKKRFRKNFEKPALADENTTLPLHEPGVMSAETEISLFGGFRMIHQGQDISARFYSKIRQLFILLLIHPEGVSVQEISSCLWPGFSPQKAKDNRGTSIQNMKKILSEVPGVQLEYAGKKWLVKTDATVYVDFCRFRELVSQLSVTVQASMVDELLLLLRRGCFLHSVEAEWADDKKAAVTNEVIELLTPLLSAREYAASPEMRLRIAETMLIFDEVNEDAISEKIRLLVHQGKTNQARQSYEAFAKTFRYLYDEECRLKFSDFLK